MKAWIFPLIAACLSFSAASYAADQGDKSGGVADTMDEAANPPSFKEMDANGDGMISEDELNVYGSSAAGKAHAQDESLHELDLDGDGTITGDEYEYQERRRKYDR